MHPILIEIGPTQDILVRLHARAELLDRDPPRGEAGASGAGINQDHIYDMSIILILAAVIGSRMLYILTHRADYHSLLDIVALWQGGATFYGGFILAARRRDRLSPEEEAVLSSPSPTRAPLRSRSASSSRESAAS